MDYLPIGIGKASFPNGDIYEGPYEDGKRNGKGKYTYKNGAIYDGQYVQNHKTGYGVMTYPDKGIYEGLVVLLFPLLYLLSIFLYLHKHLKTSKSSHLNRSPF